MAASEIGVCETTSALVAAGEECAEQNPVPSLKDLQRHCAGREGNLHAITFGCDSTNPVAVTAWQRNTGLARSCEYIDHNVKLRSAAYEAQRENGQLFYFCTRQATPWPGSPQANMLPSQARMLTLCAVA